MVRGRKSNDPGMSSDRLLSGHLDDWSESAVDYIDGRLDAPTTSALEAHLDGCPECAARLGTQRSVLALLSDTTLATPPTDLEAKVLGSLQASVVPSAGNRLFSRRRSTGEVKTRPRALPTGPWLPGLAGAAAVVALVLALTISHNPTALDETMTTVAAVFSSESATTQTARDGGTDQSVTAASLLGSSDSVADGGPTTTATDVAGLTLAALQPVGPLLEEESAMATGLAQASAPAYFFFDTPDGTLVTTEQADAVVSSLTSATGLQLMDQTLSSDVRAFAAFVPRDDSPAVVHLLYSIGDSLQLSVCLSLQPGQELADWAEAMIKDKSAVAELSAVPATPSGWKYTTSTSSTLVQNTSTTIVGATTTEQTDTRVLVVIFMAIQD